MSGPSPRPLTIAPDLRAQLMKVSRSSTASYAHVQRAITLLYVADGLATTEVARRTGQTDRSVRKWKARFEAKPHLETLDDAPRSGRKSRIGLDVRVAAMRIACERPDAVPKTPRVNGKPKEKEPPPKRFRDLWTHKSLAAAVEQQTGVKISKSEIGRILRFNGLRPHLVKQWLTSSDKDFKAKAARVCSVYLDTPADEVVLCVDEKPIQVLARRFPDEVAPDGSIHREFEYIRHGTRCLLAAFDVRTGRVIVELVPRRTGEALVAFMQRVADAFPGKTIHVVWDNLNTHDDGKTARWTRFNERNGGRFHFVRTPIHASWLNQVEIWFSILQRRVIRFGDFKSAEVLAERVLGFAGVWNAAEAHPFKWTWRSDRPQNPRRRPAHRPYWMHAEARR
ncbi:MAG: IS630 family transposase [Myxococcota bacterium]